MKILLQSALLLLTLTACASKKDKVEIKQKTENSTVNNPVALGEIINQTINDSTNLSEDQKQKLKNIVETNKATAIKLSEESYQTRSVLIQELLAKNVSSKKIKILKKNIEKIEMQKLKNTFLTIEMISAVVANNPEAKNFSEALKNFERPYQQR